MKSIKLVDFLVLESLILISLSTALISIPVIDISDLFSSKLENRLKVADEIKSASENVGFFVIVGHNISQSIIDNAWRSTELFFAAPLDEKLPYELDQNVYPFGYTSFGGQVIFLFHHITLTCSTEKS